MILLPFEWTLVGAAPLLDLVDSLRAKQAAGQHIVTTNGCFDLLHVGHIHFLQAARDQGDVLVVGLNSDDSVRRLKGQDHPIIPLAHRAEMLLALCAVDHVVVFDDLLPNDFLARIRPDTHCKAGDYSVDSLPEAQVVQQYGGQVKILLLTDGYSTSRLVERIKTASQASLSLDEQRIQVHSEPRTQVIEQLLAGSNVLRQTAYRLSEQIVLAADCVTKTLTAGGKVLLCGNGGSAADAQHIAAEVMGPFRQEREPWAAVALTTNTSIITAVGNDYSFEAIFARQVAALGRPGDVLIALSTSGDSQNILNAIEMAHSRGLYVVGLTGSRPAPMMDLVDLCLSVPAEDTALVQQAHLAILHIVRDLVEHSLVHGNQEIQPTPAVSG